jgi:GT2 family glycosyltransferase
MMPSIQLFAVVVLYKTAPHDSISVTSLQKAIDQLPAASGKVEVLLYNNTPGPSQVDPSSLPAHVRYESSGKNLGLAAAYNRALELAEGGGSQWLLTLDQDTVLPVEFLERLFVHIERLGRAESIAAVLPHVVAQGTKLSPTRYVLGAVRRPYPGDFNGIAGPHTFAFNSGATLRIAALREIGGYDPRFWLDYSDFSLFRHLEKRGKRFFIGGDIEVEHGFSMFDRVPKITPERYSNIVSAGSAFWDMEMNTLAGLDHTARLAFRYFKHLGRRGNPAFRKTTLNMLKKRLFHSKAYRIREWERENAVKG